MFHMKPEGQRGVSHEKNWDSSTFYTKGAEKARAQG